MFAGARLTAGKFFSCLNVLIGPGTDFAAQSSSPMCVPLVPPIQSNCATGVSRYDALARFGQLRDSKRYFGARSPAQI